MTTATAISFVQARADDGSALADLRVEAMRESLERMGRFDPVRARLRFLDGFSPEHTRHIEVNGKRIGFFVVKPTASALLLDHLYVHPDYQRRNVGGAVLKQVFAEADSAIMPVRVGALRGSDSNRFYARHGFVLVEQGEFDNYYLRQCRPPLPQDADVEAISRFILLSDRLATAGQPSERQLADVAAAGFRVVINLALHDDPSYALPDEGATVAALGMDYVHIPVQFSSPGLDALARFSAAMAAAEGEKVFVHCRHNKRVPVFIALDRVLRQGWNREVAFSAMQRVWSPDASWQSFISHALEQHSG